MTIEQVRAAVPSLEIGDDNPLMRGVRMGVRRFPEGYTLRVRLRATSWDAPSISRMKATKSFPRHRTIWSDIR
ncbi:DUF7256 domain-containing protein [Rhizobium gallicum]|uniref:DUF7256 domain-containing protein n=1 Tax=Rhizobium gallicum TaxID=56730 RepID=UPI003B8A5B1F